MYEFASVEPEYRIENEDNTTMDFQLDEIDLENLSFRFPGRSLLLKGINFSIKRGQIVTFFGEIGCGKSTLLGILQRFHSIESGDIKVNGENWNEISTVNWRSKIGAVAQQVQLFNSTILENICLEEKPNPEKVVQFCEEYGFHRFIMEFQQGYATIVNENSANLSGGQQQLIALARALFQKPKLLLLDEATAAMDRRTEHFVLDLLQNLKKNMIIIFVTHRVQVARHSDYIYTIENKTISNHGSHNDLIQFDNIYSQAYEEIILTKIT